MGKTVMLIPMFKCKACGELYHPYQFGILAVDDGRLTEQEALKKVLQANEIHECDIDKIGIAVCVGFRKEKNSEEETPETEE